MQAKVKCSNCGAEITNLTFSWGKKQWLWSLIAFLAMVAIFVWMDFWQFRQSHEFATELQVSLLDTRMANDRVDVLGELKNVGTHTWAGVSVEAEFYDAGGKFLDVASSYLYITRVPETSEHFKITLSNPGEQIAKATPKVVLKVTDARNARF